MIQKVVALFLVVCLAGSAFAQFDNFAQMMLLRHMMNPGGQDASVAQNTNALGGAPGAGSAAGQSGMSGMNRMFPLLWGSQMDIDPMMMMLMG
ncbi:Hypothetical predicted protein [Mytilus galloprovincialis]|uniref:Uncharacterized protein n=1 Tax=Mytilus galloprovincialis TaxID=29158 RepID=A0A8B6DDU8_MYTGA|nr:Hypothetical predicted protein [Mytilus galloprovincialis]